MGSQLMFSLTMEREDEIKRKIGEANFKLILSDIKRGHVKEDDIKMIALKMKAEGTHGVYLQFQNRDLYTPAYAWKRIMDEWYTGFLFQDQVNGVEELEILLKDVGLDNLAQQIKYEQPTETAQVQKEAMQDKNMLGTGLNTPLSINNSGKMTINSHNPVQSGDNSNISYTFN